MKRDTSEKPALRLQCSDIKYIQMKSITIRQPYAQLIADGRKKIEYRSWPCKHRGDLAIHAGLAVDLDECQRLAPNPESLPKGMIVAIVEMVGCKKQRDGYGWQLRNVRKIRPVAARGRLGLWNWNRNC